MEEIWKPIIGFENNYQISSLGRIFSRPRQRTKGGILKPRPTTVGYLQVSLYREGKSFTLTVHRLVAEHFLDNPSKWKCVNHKDCNKLNNYFSNLEWCSYSQNSIHAVANGRAPDNRGQNNGQYKLDKDKVKEIRKLYSSHQHTHHSLAKRFGVHRRTIGNIVQYDTWR